ncbi:uncharacterized protein LOC123557615 [Mercenaria mercenaria]|uniref:uncharacterized protein LOC123557615 n=1 Tax=Mercenaria mercenaria TaxID=6596 RepID=UPI00234EBC92|nr:uncharacterized protein LOC123557615 [Mercenaria mercenaria]
MMRFLLTLQVVCVLFVAVKADGHSELKLSEYLWEETYQEQQAALNSSLIKGMVSTKLNPASFGAYMNQDVVYIYNAQRLIQIALQRSKDPQHRQLLQKMSESYRELYEYLLVAWRIKYPSGIKLDGPCSRYLNHLYDMAINYHTIYFVTAMIPCYKLWPWLGNQIGSKQKSFGVYTQWVEENLDPNYAGFTDLEEVINRADEVGKIDRQMALRTYKRSMENERDFFSSVP